MKNPNNKFRWIALAVSLLINLCIGSVYAWSVFANPLAAVISEATGSAVTAANLSIVFTIANSVGPITMISGGFINDKIGSKWLLFIGGLLFGAGMIGSGLSKSIGLLIVCYGLGVGLAIGLIYGSTVSSSIKLFPDKKGLAGGLTTAAYGISSVLIPPVANGLIEGRGIEKAMVILGIIMMVIIVACGFIYAACFKKYTAHQNNEGSASPAAGGMKWNQMLKTPYFYVMIIMLCMGAISGLMITSQASPLAQGIFGMPAAGAAVIVSILALFNTGGRLLSGAVSDRIGIINTLRITFILFILGQALLLISLSAGSGLFIAGVCVVGLCFGSIMGIYPSFTAKKFGAAHNSVNYGIMFCGFALAGYLGPMLLNTVYNSTGAYNLAFIIAAALALAGLLLTLVKGSEDFK